MARAWSASPLRPFGGRHGWALAEARAMRISSGLAALERKLGQWGWLAVNREQARQALELLAEAIGEAARVRAAAAYRAYRLSTTKALRAEAEQNLSPALLAAFDRSHAARRAGDDLPPEARLALAEESERLAAAAVDQGSSNPAWAVMDRTSLRRGETAVGVRRCPRRGSR